MANATERRFDILKQKAGQDIRQQTQEAQEGMKRQFARLGGIGTGAFTKQQRLTQEAGAKRLGEAQQNIEFQRLGELQRQQDIKEARAFQTAEREAGQTFAAEQLGRQQEFARAERLGAQEFGASQAELQRKFASGERVAAQEFQRGMFDITNQNALRQMDIAEKQLGMENNVNFLNARLQVAEGIKKGLFSSQDLEALPGMFGMEDPKAQLQQSGSTFGAGSTQIAADPLAELKKFRFDTQQQFAKRQQTETGQLSRGQQALVDTQTARALQRRARELGISDIQLQQAGLI